MISHDKYTIKETYMKLQLSGHLELTEHDSPVGMRGPAPPERTQAPFGSHMPSFQVEGISYTEVDSQHSKLHE